MFRIIRFLIITKNDRIPSLAFPRLSRSHFEKL